MNFRKFLIIAKLHISFKIRYTYCVLCFILFFLLIILLKAK